MEECISNDLVEKVQVSFQFLLSLEEFYSLLRKTRQENYGAAVNYNF